MLCWQHHELGHGERPSPGNREEEPSRDPDCPLLTELSYAGLSLTTSTWEKRPKDLREAPGPRGPKVGGGSLSYSACISHLNFNKKLYEEKETKNPT